MSEDQGEETELVLDRRQRPGAIPPQMVEQLIANGENLKTEAALLRQEIERVRLETAAKVKAIDAKIRSDRRLSRWLGGILIVMVAGLLALGTMNRASLIETRRATADIRALTEQVQSCVDPEGECAKRNQRETAKLLGEPRGPINAVVVAAAACGADHPGDIPATDRCVRDALTP